LAQRGNYERTPEQEKVDKQRQIPYHMHINVELMECAYLICSMLLEIPYMPCRDYDLRRRMLSRSFHYQLKQSEKATLLGPAENTREHVVAAARAMLDGDWRRANGFLFNEKMDAKVCVRLSVVRTCVCRCGICFDKQRMCAHLLVGAYKRNVCERICSTMPPSTQPYPL
jgi:hypothetical protein